ncbi:tail sheath [Synechococcus phage S-SRM01]|uniref:Terminase large subunit n=1 Tax=Synechococcus phage S-SRM01 TaxID=2781608 RepID=A0A879R394_9CAUD|nr:tail sheath [Synechococcus phage S-SRM01]QPX48176.1 terminase large subunit [Synechococcus phage S-SRM01]
MPLNLASPGIVVREVDLTLGRVAPSSDKIGAIVAPFSKGPVDSPTLVENENDLLVNFGEPYSTDKHYEHWLSASSYLAYGGALRVVRANDNDLRNGFVGTASSVKIDSLDHYNALGYDENTLSGVVVAARNPGSWSNGLKVAIIDSKADQILVGVNTSVASGITNIAVGYGVTQSIAGRINPGAGTTSVLDGYLKGIITEISGSSVYVKVLSYVSAAGTETQVDYQPSGVYAFSSSGSVAIHTSGQTVSTGSTSYTGRLDWFDQQTLGITSTSTISWNNIAPRPGTSAYAAARDSRFDEVHVVVIDALGTVTGNAGTILEKHLSLSKATDAEFSVGNPAYWRKYIVNNSEYIFGLGAPTGIVTTGYSSGFSLESDVAWDQTAEGITFAAAGASTNTLVGGKDYSGAQDLNSAGSLTATLGELSDGYDLFENTENFNVDFLLMGSAAYDISTAQALANKLISVAELRKDAIAFISPYRGAALSDTSVQTAVTVRSAADITDNVVQFYASVSSSSYAIFDSGYKYMYDRFSNTFRYVPLNGDIAGLCARNDINNFPWYSPAGTSRGAILNAVKLAYNPTKTQRDTLYSNRVNPVIFSPGAGIILFGDKTGLAKASAFDRINVRRLFVYLENAISQAAKDALFEFNDEITRTNFVNTIEPFLRDVQAKRGIFDYVVICDETNNTAAVIDNNEFVADIYIKPARSINFIGLNFIATKTGVDFEEVIGNF